VKAYIECFVFFVMIVKNKTGRSPCGGII